MEAGAVFAACLIFERLGTEGWDIKREGVVFSHFNFKAFDEGQRGIKSEE